MKKILLIVASSILVIGIVIFLIYRSYVVDNEENIDNNTFSINGIYEIGENNTTDTENVIENIMQDVERKPAYYDESGFVTDSVYIDCQIYCDIDNDNIKATIDSRIDEIKNKIMEEQQNTSGMIVINVSGNTILHEKLNILQYNETYRRYKMLKTYFDDTFSKQIMLESNKPANSNIFNVDLENNKNISYNNEEEEMYFSVKTGQRIQNISDLFSVDYDYQSVIKDRVKYMLDLNVGYSENEVNKSVNEAYDKLDIGIDLFNEKLYITLEDNGFEMFFNEFDVSQMTIY